MGQAPRTDRITRVVFPLHWFNGRASIAGIPIYSEKSEHPAFAAWPHLVASISRILLVGIASVIVDLPHGIYDFYSLGRAMGSKVLRGKLIEPAQAMASTLWQCWNIGESSCMKSFQEDSTNIEAAFFRMVVLYTCVIAVPLYTFASFCLLCCFPAHRDGVIDDAAEQEWQRKMTEISWWEHQRRRKLLDIAGLQRGDRVETLCDITTANDHTTVIPKGSKGEVKSSLSRTKRKNLKVHFDGLGLQAFSWQIEDCFPLIDTALPEQSATELVSLLPNTS